MSRRSRIALISVAALLLILAGSTAWLLDTAAGARFVANRAVAMLSPRLSIGTIQGPLAGPLIVTDVHWADPEGGIDARVARTEIDLRLGALLGGTVHVQSARISGVVVDKGPSTRPPSPPSDRPPLDPPVAIRVDRFELTDATMTQQGVRVAHVRTASVAGEWTHANLAVSALDALADEGEVHFKGTVAGTERYRGDGSGRFRWRAAEHDWVGTLDARASEAAADLTLALTAPAPATLQLKLTQQAPWPWTFNLQVPAFDPSRELLPGSALTQLAANLQGSGTLTTVTTQGNIAFNGTPLEIRNLAATRGEKAVDLRGELGFGGGRIDLEGQLELGTDVPAGRANLAWSALTVPASLAGQALATAGKLTASGSLDRYTANGDLQIGPPGRLARVQLDLSGTPTDIQLSRFDIVQPRGRLAAAGRVRLRPSIGWTVGASARAFDPGAFVTGWGGSLDFRAASTGELTDAGPEAQLALSDLSGTLRGRRVAGNVELAVDADRLVSGRADLASGASRVMLTAQRDAAVGERADARIDVASLGDWIPDARGSLRGDVHAEGRWPDLVIDANLRGASLALAGQQVGAADLTAHIVRPLAPDGRVNVNASTLRLGGFDFASLNVTASGTQQQHSVAVDLKGPRLSATTQVQGGLSGAGPDLAWQGTVSTLELASPEIKRLSLQAPVAVAWSSQNATLGEACLAGDDTRICVQGDSGPAPQLHARYTVHALPLALAAAFYPLPLTVEGALDGEGDFSRDASGAVGGHAVLRSASGRIAEPASRDEEPRELMAWRNFAAEATLQGDAARATISAGINADGQLDARGSVSGLTTAAPQIDAQLTARVPGLGVIETFVPQLLNVSGELSIDTRITGAMDAPRLDGEAKLAGVGFDLPLLGLKPREGVLTARMNGTGPLQIDGTLKSGDGQLAFQGTAELTGTADVRITGTRVLAADIPGVHVIVSPDLKVVRQTTRTDLTGKVVIPTADINLQRLPNGRRTRSISPDVVVVDDAEAAADAARSAPLTAQIDIELGDAVKITGYGLNAAVLGALSVRERPGQPTIASGELRVTGGYQAYGQDLTIDQGQLLYASTPVDNPRLAIVATRKVENVTAGFRVNGSARNPELTVFSDPSMGQANALAYIVAGKPLDQVGTGTGEGDALQSAARQLGTAAGGLLAKNVGKRLGVDELGIKDSASIGGAALTVGQYLSPRLYLGYGVGLFEPGQVVMLRYKFSRSLSLTAEQGTLNSRAGVEFRKEK